MAKDFLSGGQNRGSGMAVGGLGALAGALLGGGSGAAKGAIGGGVMALLGSLAVSLLSIKVDTAVEKEYVQRLAGGLKLESEAVSQIHQVLGV